MTLTPEQQVSPSEQDLFEQWARPDAVQRRVDESGSYTDRGMAAAFSGWLARSKLERVQREGEPVATLHDDGHWTHKPGRDPLDQFSGLRRLDVFAHPAPQPAIPEGFVLVPKEATREICEAAHFGPNCAEDSMRASDRQFWEDCWRAMISVCLPAAPKEPA